MRRIYGHYQVRFTFAGIHKKKQTTHVPFIVPAKMINKKPITMLHIHRFFVVGMNWKWIANNMKFVDRMRVNVPPEISLESAMNCSSVGNVCLLFHLFECSWHVHCECIYASKTYIERLHTLKMNQINGKVFMWAHFQIGHTKQYLRGWTLNNNNNQTHIREIKINNHSHNAVGVFGNLFYMLFFPLHILQPLECCYDSMLLIARFFALLKRATTTAPEKNYIFIHL